MNVEDIESEPVTKGRPVSVCLDSLIEYAAERLAFSVRKYALKKEISLILYGEDPKNPGVEIKRINPASFEKILTKARSLLKVRSLTSSEQAHHESIGFYENMLADEDTPASARIKARENLDRIKATGSAGAASEQIIDLNEIDIMIRKKILDGIRNPSSSD